MKNGSLNEITDLKTLAEKVINKFSPENLKDPNVVGMGFGHKITKNKDTKQPCITFFVIKKVPKNDVALFDSVILPTQLKLDDFKIQTDIIESGPFNALLLTDRHRPARPGVSIGHVTGQTGTFGAVVIDNETGNQVILSNNHVLAKSNNASVGDEILQPGRQDGGSTPDDVIGTLLRFITITFTLEDYNAVNTVDAAICLPTTQDLIRKEPGINDVIIYHAPTPTQPAVGLLWADSSNLSVFNNINDVISELNISFPEPNSVVTAPEVGMEVQKIGRTTGDTRGLITAISATITVSFGGMGYTSATLTNQIITARMSGKGDSGSLGFLKQPKNGCFIATAAYGTPLSPRLNVLRNWRDSSLNRTSAGKTFVIFYYSLSPPIAKIISKSKGLKATVRMFLNPFVNALHRRNPLWIKYE